MRLTTPLISLVLSTVIAAGCFGVDRGGAVTVLAASRCTNVQLAVTPYSSMGATGHVDEMFRLHNLSPSSCTLDGYPGALLLDRTFHSLPTTVTRSPWPQGGPGPKTITLAPQQDAYMVVRWDHFPSPGDTCPRASYLMITAPNNRLPVVTYAGKGGAPITVCGGKLTVSPVAATPFWHTG